MTAATDYILTVKLARTNPTKSVVYAPRYPKKISSPGWFITVGDVGRMELLHLKRMHQTGHARSIVSFVYRTPVQPGNLKCLFFIQ